MNIKKDRELPEITGSIYSDELGVLMKDVQEFVESINILK